MDRVRLGRALGYGTRHAARTLAAVAEAATAPRPGAAPQAMRSEAARADTPPASLPQGAVSSPRRASAARAMPSTGQVQQASHGVLRPLVAFSGALWLRVTGLFFGLVGLALLNGAWRLRGVVTGAAHTREQAVHLWMFLGFALLFLYFAGSGFVRARARERRG